MSDTIEKRVATTEIGRDGLEVWGGLVQEEFLRSLQGKRGRETFREMSLNDAVCGSMLYAIEMFLRPVEWVVEPFDKSTRAMKDAEFVQSVYDDMEYTWSEFISEWMAAPVYGFAPFEIVWKIRAGYKSDSGLSSQFNDRKLGISKLAVRHPDTLDKWEYSDQGELLGMWQSAPRTFEKVLIPMDRLLLFTVLQRKGSPEGTSLLRRAHIAWHHKKRIEEIEGIGIERELAGLPMFTTPAKWWAEDASSGQKALLEEVKQMARRIRADEQMGIVLPAVFDEDGNELLTFKLVSTGGARAIETGPAKEYYSRQIAMSILADVILLGHESVGSFALSDSKTNLFSNGLGSLLDGIEDVHNKRLIPRILSVNGRDPSRPPKLRHGDLETPDLDVVGEYVSRLAGAGFMMFPTEDGELERALFRNVNLPEEAVDQILDRMKKEKKAQETKDKAALATQAAAQAETQDRGLAGDGPKFPNQQVAGQG